MFDKLPYGLILRQLSAVIVAVVIPLVIGIIPSIKISSLDQFFIGVLVYVTVTVAGLSYDIVRLLDQRVRAVPLERIEDLFGVHLHNIAAGFKQIVQHSHQERDLFTEYFTRAIEKFEDQINVASSKRELVVNELHVSTTSMLLHCLFGRESDLLRFVHYFQDNEFMLDVWSRGYYTLIVKMIEERHIREVRRLFVYTDRSQLDDPTSKRLIEFHLRQRGYDCRVISDADYKKLIKDANLGTLDFGIYGDLYVYETRYATAQRIEGIYSSAPSRVRSFIEAFDNCWRHGQKPHSTNSTQMTLFELFEGVRPPEELGEFVDQGPLPRGVSWRKIPRNDEAS